MMFSRNALVSVGFVSTVFASGCGSGQLWESKDPDQDVRVSIAPAAASSELPAASAARIPSVRETFPKEKKEESAALLKILRDSKVVGTKSGHQVVYRAYGVDCRVNESGKYSCTHGLSAGCSLKACRQPVKDSEALAGLLFGMPVAQGDSGAMTPYIECVSSSDDPKFAACSIATQLDYRGP